jgi:flavorubredoxin
MKPINLTDDIYYLGVDDQQTDLFEALWPLPYGVSYNSFLIKDKKTALIDAVEKKFSHDYLQKIEQILKNQPLDYLIINHMEPDHSGSVKALISKYPNLKIVGNHKTVGFLQGFYNINEDKVHQVKTGDSLSLGKHQLEFTQIPMVHWPETMVTYESSQNVLFSGDAFGGFKTLEGKIFDDDHKNLEEYIDEARRYFANILGAYTRPTSRAIKNLSKLKIKTLAPAHGLVWRKNPEKIIESYRKWSQQETEKGVVIAYGSMYGHTKKMAQMLAAELEEKKIAIKIHDAARVHRSFILKDIWQYQGLILASSTYTNDLFPPMAHLVRSLSERKIKNHIVGLIGNYSWTGGAMRKMDQFVENNKLELLEPKIRTQYGSDEKTEGQIKKLAKNLLDTV